MSAMESLPRRIAELLEELTHADGLIDRLVAENERLRAERDHLRWVVAAFRDRAEQGRGLSVVEGGRCGAARVM